MISFLKKFNSLFVLVILFLSFSLSHVDAVTINLDTVLSGDTPGGTAPWLTATFEDGGSGTVDLTLSASGLVDDEFIGGRGGNGWFFNFDGDATSLTFSYVSGNDADNIALGNNSYQAGPDGKFDIQFEWYAGDRLTSGQSASYNISYTSSISPSDFLLGSVPGGGAGSGFTSVAHVQGIGTSAEGSSWIRSNGKKVPEPSTLLLLGTGLIGIAIVGKKKLFP